MARATTTIDFSQTLSTLLEGTGVTGSGIQFFDDAAPLAGVPCHSSNELPELEEASLDFAIVGPESSARENAVELLRMCRLSLREGGRMVVFVDTESCNAAAMQRLVTLECGVACDVPQTLASGLIVLSGRRSVDDGLRRGFSLVANEVGRVDRPATWRGEFYFDLATVLLQAGESRRAAECFRVALEEDERNVEARIGLAMALSLSADLDESKSLLEEVLQAEPDNSLAATWLQRCRARAAETDSDPTILTPAVRRER